MGMDLSNAASRRRQAPPVVSFGTDVRVAVVDDNVLFRQMLTSTLRAVSGIIVTAECASVADARERVLPGLVDLVVMDIALSDGNGVSLGISLQRRDPRLRILLLSAHNAMDLLLDLPENIRDRWSYLSKNSSTSVNTLVSTIERTMAGRSVLDPFLLEKTAPRAGTAVSRLSKRRYEVLKLVAQGMSNAGIAEELGITDKSVQNHINAIYADLGIDPDRSSNPRVLATLRMLEESGSLID
ncbi:two component transcriptional regulator, LuxR family [Micrococcales bacterium KH10]|nr:two component transcriptional regulator, LuxR family [Micrococcales bacterium KH10]